MGADVVAYAFSSYRDTDEPEPLASSNSPTTASSNSSDMAQNHLVVFTSSEECRRVVSTQPVTVSVVVCDSRGETTPINLAAALCVDAPERDVYLLDENPDESLAFRAHTAGIRGLLNSEQASKLLGINRQMLQKCSPSSFVNNAPQSGGAQAANTISLVTGASLTESSSSSGRNACLYRIPLVETSSFFRGAPSAAAHARLLQTAPELAATTQVELPQTAPELAATTQAGLPHTTPALVAFEQKTPTTDRANSGRIIGFLSGRGGVGKSTVALMCALSAQSRGKPVALVDLDLQFGDLDYLAGNEPSSRIQRIPLEQAIYQTGCPSYSKDTLTLIIPPKRPELGEAYISYIPSLLQKLADQYDLVVVNTGSFWTEVHAQISQYCSLLIFLMDQRATSIEACKQVVDLCVRMRLPQARFVYALNGCGRHASLTPMDVMLALGGVEVFGLADGGSLVDELLALGCPMELLRSGNAFINSLEVLLDSLLGQQNNDANSSIIANMQGKARLFDLSLFKNLLRRPQHVTT